jgi:hypothetical protein
MGTANVNYIAGVLYNWPVLSNTDQSAVWLSLTKAERRYILPRIGTWLNVNETVRDVLRNVVQHIVDENDETVNCEENDLLYDSQWWGACREVFCGLY